MAEGDIYRELGAEMRQGLKQIYQQISTATESGNTTEALFEEASDQLHEVVKATETAAMDIMEIVEKLLDKAAANLSRLDDLAARYGDDPDLAALRASENEQVNDLTKVLTALSFQDITGQRIKTVLGVLSGIERSVVDLYLSSGVAMAVADRNPEKDAGEIREEAKKAVEAFRQGGSQLKGPDANAISQQGIDDMLAQLGL